MNKYYVGTKKRLIIGVLAIAGIIGIVSIHQVTGSEAQATEINRVADGHVRPAHPYAYKLGDAMDVEGSINNYERTTEKQREILKAQRDAVEAERLAAKKEAEEKLKVEQAVEQAEETPAVVEEKNQTEVQTTQATNKAAVKPSQSSPQPKAEAKPAATLKAAEQKAEPKPEPKPEPKKPAIGSNKIGINGNYKSYTNYGRASTDKLQSGIDAGLIVAGLNNFNGNDGATTYFGGHNPGVMNFMAGSIRVGAIITVTDSNGNAFNYKMTDKVDVDEYGEGVLKSIGVSAIDAYMYGTGSESILIQFCNTNNNLMSFWYGVKI